MTVVRGLSASLQTGVVAQKWDQSRWSKSRPGYHREGEGLGTLEAAERNVGEDRELGLLRAE